MSSSVAFVIVLIVAAAAVTWYLLTREKITARDWAIAAVLLSWTAGVAIKVHYDGAERGAGIDAVAVARAMHSELVRGESVAPGATSPSAPAAGGVEAAPVASLIGGLEARLAEHPDDASGWTLLAQSYAFVGDAQGVERAVQRAVALGVDEQDLRERVRSAWREPQPVDWVRQAVGG